MKTITIRQLHEATGRLVREARGTPLIVTDRGARVAVIRPFSAEDLVQKPFPARKPASLPSVKIDSTKIISEDRSAR